MKWADEKSAALDRLPATAFDRHRLPASSPRLGARRGAASGRGGFTLIEVLVATTILMVIVLMVSMVFQQSSGAFQGGVRRVKNQTVLRGILGTITRELVMAMDSELYPGLTPNNFTESKVSFVALSGPPDETSGLRAPQVITFAYNNGYVTRTVANISYKHDKNSGSGTWKAGASSPAVTLNPDKKLSGFAFKMVASKDGLPLRVDIEARLITSGEDSLVSASSAGADGKWDTKDDIVVGGR